MVRRIVLLLDAWYDKLDAIGPALARPAAILLDTPGWVDAALFCEYYVCHFCNAFKGPNIAGRDPATKNVERLFNPRQDDWQEHFRWDGPALEARTAIGRVTLAVLRINLPYRVAVRASLMGEKLFAP